MFDAPTPAWTPGAHVAARANLTKFMIERNFASYRDLWHWSVAHRASFWEAVIDRLGIVFRKSPTQILDISPGPEYARWLPGAELNIVESCFQHDPNTTALIHQRNGAIHRVTYGELEALVDRAATSFDLGQPVAIAMPMNLEAVVAYLGIVKSGGTVVSIADSFSVPEIATRLRIAGATVAVTQDVIRRGSSTYPMARRVWDAGATRTITVTTNATHNFSLRDSDVSWRDFLGDGSFHARSGPPTRCTNVLFSSGTTGEPKAIPWNHLTPVKAAMDGHFHQDIQPGDVACWPTNLGWMMGPWLIYASLINGAALALFDDAPTGRAFGEFVRDAGVTMLGVVPSLVSRWRTTRCMEGLDWNGIRAFSSTGEASRESDMGYLMELAGGKPIVEYCGGTEIGGGYITGTVIQPCAPATFTTPTLGLDVEILDERGQPADEGELFLVPPSIGLSTELLNRDHHDTYYAGVPRAGLRRHGDHFARLRGGYFRALGRVDDTMNLGGIKVSSAELERTMVGIEGLKEVAAIAVAPPGGGPDRLVVYAVAKEKFTPNRNEWLRTMQRAVREGLNPLFRISQLHIVDELPRTASNKVMRRELRARTR